MNSSANIETADSLVISAYLSMGLALVPIPRGHKGPRHRDWNRPERLITDPSESWRLNSYNVGIAHANCSPSPTCAVDIDDFGETQRWLELQYEIDLLYFLNAPGTAVCWSGTNNKLKVFYRLPLGHGPLRTKQVRGTSGQMMVEFRCASANGLTMQDLVPPSIHPSGRPYQWIGHDDALALTEIPSDLLDIWQRLLSPPSTKTAPSRIVANAHMTPRAVATLEHQLGSISADCSYDAYRSVIWAILSTGWSCAPDIALSWSTTAPHRFNQACLDNLIRDYDPTQLNGPTLGTIVHLARLGGWHG